MRSLIWSRSNSSSSNKARSPFVVLEEALEVEVINSAEEMGAVAAGEVVEEGGEGVECSR